MIDHEIGECGSRCIAVFWTSAFWTSTNPSCRRVVPGDMEPEHLEWRWVSPFEVEGWTEIGARGDEEVFDDTDPTSSLSEEQGRTGSGWRVNCFDFVLLALCQLLRGLIFSRQRAQVVRRRSDDAFTRHTVASFAKNYEPSAPNVEQASRRAERMLRIGGDFGGGKERCGARRPHQGR
ncbi:hypothetical protein CMUS01_07011 [Colletotrichum musicola]|uniref:Uncharacterized protein n=1 Tax=Colletotrichum musicola TaxID=2175873 RepID=A0A8H6KJR8_9PEZI|nr:hypothetical protein CMUS01_07011 [Colletotrichum musicola]